VVIAVIDPDRCSDVTAPDRPGRNGDLGHHEGRRAGANDNIAARLAPVTNDEVSLRRSRRASARYAWRSRRARGGK